MGESLYQTIQPQYITTTYFDHYTVDVTTHMTLSKNNLNDEEKSINSEFDPYNFHNEKNRSGHCFPRVREHKFG